MKKLLLGVLLASYAIAGFSVTPLWMRNPRISPDGEEIAFCYNGNI